MECCFSIVCKECVGIAHRAQQSTSTVPDPNNNKNDGGDDQQTTKSQPKRICLACLEPCASDGNGYQPLSYEKYLVLVSLLSSLNESQKSAS